MRTEMLPVILRSHLGVTSGFVVFQTARADVELTHIARVRESFFKFISEMPTPGLYLIASSESCVCRHRHSDYARHGRVSR